jgi:L-arabinose isomerase
MEDFAEMLNIEMFKIGEQTTLTNLKSELKINELYYR